MYDYKFAALVIEHSRQEIGLDDSETVRALMVETGMSLSEAEAFLSGYSIGRSRPVYDEAAYDRLMKERMDKMNDAITAAGL